MLVDGVSVEARREATISWTTEDALRSYGSWAACVINGGSSQDACRVPSSIVQAESIGVVVETEGLALCPALEKARNSKPTCA